MFWDDPTAQLVENARGKSVTKNRLTKTGARVFGASYLKDRPIIDYLEEGEQPHHIFFNRTKGVTIYVGGSKKKIDPDMAYSTYATLTDRRVIVIVPQKDNDVLFGVDYEYAHAARFQTGTREHQMDIATGNDGLTFYINNSIKAAEVEEARDFIVPRLNPESTSGSIINAPDFEIVNDIFDFNIETSGPELTTIGRESSTSGGQSAAHRSENRSEIEEPELVEKLRRLDAYSFEELIADIWKQRGWNAVATAESGDRGVDVVAERRDPIPEKQLIQAKKYKAGNTVGSRDIQQYSSLRHQQKGVDSVVIVTTSTFTKQAKELADDLNVKLVDIDLLCELIRLEDAYDIVRWHTGEREVEDDADDTSGSGEPAESDEATEQNAGTDPVEEIRRIRELKDEGILSEDEFETKKQELLDRI